jgi:glutathione synthase/RimK-type ligase-like ATP-grasp enzyme
MILADRHSRPSAKLLALAMGEISGVKLPVVSDVSKLEGKISVRYGCSDDVTGIEDTNFNSADFIKLCANKRRFSKLLTDNGFYTPVFNSEGVPTEYPVLIREFLSASGGKGIHLISNEEEFSTTFKKGFYWTPFVVMKNEYRVHVLGDKIAKVFRKDRNPGLDVEQFPIKNLHLGYHFYKISNPEGFDKMQEVINSLCKLLNGSFIALDVGWVPSEKKYFIIEGNTAPGLNKETVKMYADFLTEKLGGP